ncbi:MAG TPA: hypothetical protein VNK82_10105 [Terriglobales bacterium]|nr:hypothetical protein [Terriglobales bacterium]
MPQVEEGQSVVLEPKYCEACGALWMRPSNESVPYCERCRKRMAGISRRERVPGDWRPR